MTNKQRRSKPDLFIELFAFSAASLQFTQPTVKDMAKVKNKVAQKPRRGKSSKNDVTVPPHHGQRRRYHQTLQPFTPPARRSKEDDYFVEEADFSRTDQPRPAEIKYRPLPEEIEYEYHKEHQDHVRYLDALLKQDDRELEPRCKGSRLVYRRIQTLHWVLKFVFYFKNLFGDADEDEDENLHPPILFAAFNLVHRQLGSASHMRKCFLIAACALRLAWKYDVNDALVPSVAQWQHAVYICSKRRITITTKEILEGDKEIWETMDHSLGWPGPIPFIMFIDCQCVNPNEDKKKEVVRKAMENFAITMTETSLLAEPTETLVAASYHAAQKCVCGEDRVTNLGDSCDLRRVATIATMIDEIQESRKLARNCKKNELAAVREMICSQYRAWLDKGRSEQPKIESADG